MTDGFQQGDVIDGRYRIVRKLGAGGMADVYLAHDEVLGRRVAVKVLLSRFADDEQFVERFRREARAAAALNHPNIVSVYDRGTVDHTYYIVMEYLQGETLKDMIRRRGRLAPEEAIAFALQLLSAVQYAHEHGVIHRDIKSQNIMVDQDGRVRVTDFGIARAGDPSMTEVGSVLGTAQYLAPEQAKGQPADERSDIYAVGIVLYEMLTGGVPFRGDSAVSVALKHVNELPAEPRALVPDLPPALNQVVLKALAKNPERRYASAQQFARDLRALRSGAPLIADTFDLGEERTQVVAPLPFASDAPTRVLAGQTQTLPASPRVGAGGSAAEPPEGGQRRHRVWPWVLLVIFLAVAGVGGYLLYHTFVGTAVTVPNVVGSSQAVATQTLTNAGFKVKVQSDFSDQFAVGFVDRQSPPANTKLVKGESVTIWVVKGALHLQLPSFIGQTPKYVETFLSQNGLVGKRLSGTSNTVPAGTVFKQSPPGGTTVARGDTVTYWVSKGPAQVLVPDVTGTDKATAASMLKAAGLALGSVTTQPSDTVQKGYVISQSPAPNTQVDKGSAVDLVLSSGPSPSPSPSPTTSPTGAQVTVPPVIGMDVTTATTTLSDAGLLVSVKQKPHTGQPSGTVVDQNPAADTVVPEGTVVTLTVAK